MLTGRTLHAPRAEERCSVLKGDPVPQGVKKIVTTGKFPLRNLALDRIAAFDLAFGYVWHLALLALFGIWLCLALESIVGFGIWLWHLALAFWLWRLVQVITFLRHRGGVDESRHHHHRLPRVHETKNDEQRTTTRNGSGQDRDQEQQRRPWTGCSKKTINF